MTSSELASMVTVLGNTAAAVAAAEGDTALSQTIMADTKTAATAIATWTSGPPSAEVIQVLNLLVVALQTIPQVGPYMILIDIAVATLEEVIALVVPPSVVLPKVAK